jgi:hypothetical protein
VSRWRVSDGSFIGSVPLNGFGSVTWENTYPANRGIAAAGGYYLTYSNSVLSAWNAAGERVATTTLNQAGSTLQRKLLA